MTGNLSSGSICRQKVGLPLPCGPSVSCDERTHEHHKTANMKALIEKFANVPDALEAHLKSQQFL